MMSIPVKPLPQDLQYVVVTSVMEWSVRYHWSFQTSSSSSYPFYTCDTNTDLDVGHPLYTGHWAQGNILSPTLDLCLKTAGMRTGPLKEKKGSFPKPYWVLLIFVGFCLMMITDWVHGLYTFLFSHHLWQIIFFKIKNERVACGSRSDELIEGVLVKHKGG